MKVMRRKTSHKISNSALAIALPISLSFLSMLAMNPASASMNCADTLPSSYFKRIDDDRQFAGKLVTLADGTQQLEDLSGAVTLDGLTDAYILMDKYLWAQRHGKYGIVTATGKIIVPFVYDDIRVEPDIGTSFIVSVNLPNGLTKQGIVDRNGYWIYPKPEINQQDKAVQQPQRRVDNGYGDYSYAKATAQPIKAVDMPFNLANSSINHAHYDSDKDRDYFLIQSLSKQMGNTTMTDKVGLLDDQGSWIIPQKYNALQPLNACTGKPLYLQATLNQQNALITQQHTIVIPFALNQHIEAFNSNITPLLFLRSTLIEGSTATGMSEDIRDDIVSAQIIDEKGKLRLSSTAPITKLLYHQLYAYQQAGKYGFINDKAEIVLSPQFKSYRDEGDKVWVEKNGKMVRLDTLIKLE